MKHSIMMSCRVQLVLAQIFFNYYDKKERVQFLFHCNPKFYPCLYCWRCIHNAKKEHIAILAENENELFGTIKMVTGDAIWLVLVSNTENIQYYKIPKTQNKIRDAIQRTKGTKWKNVTFTWFLRFYKAGGIIIIIFLFFKKNLSNFNHHHHPNV